MRYEKFQEDHPGVWVYIKNNYLDFKDFELSEKIEKIYDIRLDPEKIRNIRRAEDWKKKEVENNGDFERVAFINCLHIPFLDEKILTLLVKFLKYFKPHKLYSLGDYLDWYSISQFNKDPGRIGRLQTDIDMGNTILDQLCKLVDDIEWLDGNHEYRMIRYLRRNPEFYGLKCLEISSLLHLKKRGIKHHPYMQPPISHHGFQIHHGSVIRKYSGWTAKGHWEKFGGCGIVGHSHRLGNFVKRNTQGIFGWYENGCLCSLEPEYLDFADWIQGWSIAYFTKKDLFHLEQIPIVKHQFLFQGRLFSI